MIGDGHKETKSKEIFIRRNLLWPFLHIILIKESQLLLTMLCGQLHIQPVYTCRPHLTTPLGNRLMAGTGSTILDCNLMHGVAQLCNLRKVSALPPL